jgi:hypothetical protein
MESEQWAILRLKFKADLICAMISNPSIFKDVHLHSMNYNVDEGQDSPVIRTAEFITKMVFDIPKS